MEKQTYLHIPEPCHENWEVMTPVQQGRFCESCSKKVIDFSKMTDKQVMDILSKAAGNTCGRFSANQLERPIIKETPFLLMPHTILLSAFIPAFLAATPNLIQAQGKWSIAEKNTTVNSDPAKNALKSATGKITGSIKDAEGMPIPGASILIKGTVTGTSTNAEGQFQIPYPTNKEKVTLVITSVGFKQKEVEVSKIEVPLNINLELEAALTGEVMVLGYLRSSEQEEADDGPAFIAVTKKTLYGRIVNEQGEPIAHASVKVNSRKGVIADAEGNFELRVKENKKKISLAVSSVGYAPKDSSIDLTHAKRDSITITLSNNEALDEVIVSCSVASLTGRVGLLSVVRTVTTIDTAKTFIQKVFNNEMFQAHPNPSTKGASVQLSFIKPGTYSVQLFDNSGRLYTQKEMTIEGRQNASFDVPASIHAGIYYIRAINTSSRKQFIDKLIIQ